MATVELQLCIGLINLNQYGPIECSWTNSFCISKNILNSTIGKNSPIDTQIKFIFQKIFNSETECQILSYNMQLKEMKHRLTWICSSSWYLTDLRESISFWSFSRADASAFRSSWRSPSSPSNFRWRFSSKTFREVWRQKTSLKSVNTLRKWFKVLI